MCTIILKITPDGVWIGANRDERVDRPWEMPAEYWPGIVAGRDVSGGGTWLGVNRHGVAAAVLNRTGTLGPAPGKNSRGELPLMALGETSAAAAVERLRGLDTGMYRSFNLVAADATGAFLLRGLEAGPPEVSVLAEGVTMITSGEPNDALLPRIARHLPKFAAAGFEDWGKLLGDGAGDWERTLNIPERDGFGTVCSSLIALPRSAPAKFWFAKAGKIFDFQPVA